MIFAESKLEKVFHNVFIDALMSMKRTVVYDEYYSRSEIRAIILVNKKDVKKLKRALKKVIEENGWDKIVKVTSCNDGCISRVIFGLKENLNNEKLETFITLLKLKGLI